MDRQDKLDKINAEIARMEVEAELLFDGEGAVYAACWVLDAGEERTLGRAADLSALGICQGTRVFATMAKSTIFRQ